MTQSDEIIEINKNATFKKFKERFSTEKFRIQVNPIKFPTFLNKEINLDIEEDLYDLSKYQKEFEEASQSLDRLWISYSKLIMLSQFSINNKILNQIKEKFECYKLDIWEYLQYISLLKRHLAFSNLIILNREKIELGKTIHPFFQNILQFKSNIQSDYIALFKNLQITNSKLNFIFTEKYENTIYKHFDDLNECINLYLKHLNFHPSYTMLIIALKFINSICNTIDKSCVYLLQKYSSKEIGIICLNLVKIKILTENFHYIIKTSSNDLFNFPENSEKWLTLKNVIERRIYFEEDHMQNRLSKIYRYLSVINAAVMNAYDLTRKKSKIQFVNSLFYLGFFFLFKKYSDEDSIRNKVLPSFEVLRISWNYLEENFIKAFVKLNYTGIKTVKKFLLKRTHSKIDKEFIQNILKFMEGGEKIFFNATSQINGYILNGNNYNTNNNFSNNGNTIKITFKDFDRIIIPIKKMKHYKNFLTNYVKVRIITPKTLIYPKSLIIHIHGGGFISLSSSTHEVYTRIWAKNLGVSVISIDYGLSPEHAYPDSLDDIYQAYVWIINNYEKEFKTQLENIILIGESAGGTFSMALTYLLIILNKRRPDAILLAYPALVTSVKIITPSYFNSLYDDILSYQSMKFCIDAFKKDYNNERDPFISPLVASDWLLSNLPPLRIMYGSYDPLRDYMIYFINRLV